MLASLCEVYAHLEVSATFSVQLCDKPATLRHALAMTVQDYRKVLGISCSLKKLGRKAEAASGEGGHCQAVKIMALKLWLPEPPP